MSGVKADDRFLEFRVATHIAHTNNNRIMMIMRNNGYVYKPSLTVVTTLTYIEIDGFSSQWKLNPHFDSCDI